MSGLAVLWRKRHKGRKVIARAAWVALISLIVLLCDAERDIAAAGLSSCGGVCSNKGLYIDRVAEFSGPFFVSEGVKIFDQPDDIVSFAFRERIGLGTLTKHALSRPETNISFVAPYWGDNVEVIRQRQWHFF